MVADMVADMEVEKVADKVSYMVAYNKKQDHQRWRYITVNHLMGI